MEAIQVLPVKLCMYPFVKLGLPKQHQFPDIVIPELFYLDNSNSETLRISLMHKKGNELNTLKQNIESVFIDNMTKEFQVSYLIVQQFHELECCGCNHKQSAFETSQNTIGLLCYFCWLHSGEDWKPVKNLIKLLKVGI